MDFVSAGKNALLLYVTVCEKVVPRLDKYDDVIEWNFMKIAPPPKWRAGCAPAPTQLGRSTGYREKQSHTRVIDSHWT